MWSGVGKSGSPAPKPMTSTPPAFSALALASTASVADSAIAAIRAEMRAGVVSTSPWWHATPRGNRTCAAPRPSLNPPMHRRPSVACAALVVLLAALIAAALVAPAGAGATRVGAPQSPPPQAFIVVDARSGAVLAAGHEHAALPPASVAKIMTAVTAVERGSANASITVSPLAARQPARPLNIAAGPTP